MMVIRHNLPLDFFKCAYDWEQRKLKEIANKVSEKNKNNEFSEPFTNSAEQGIISQKDYFDREIVNNENLNGYYIVRNNDFIYNPRISVTAPVGPINRNRLGRSGVMSPLYTVFRTHNTDNLYLEFYFKTTKWHRFMKLNGDSGARFDRFTISSTQFMEMPIPYPTLEEQRKIGEYFDSLDNLITLHRRAHFHPTKEDLQMTTTTGKDNLLFCDYYKQWITVYKEGAIRPVTMSKYLMAHKWVEKLVPELSIKDLDRFSYQKLLNDYAAEHERQTTMDFHHHLKCAILDAVDEGLIPSDPTRKAIIKGKPSRNKKPKYLNQYELHKLLDDLNLDPEVNLDWMILLIAKTGMRFSEALGLTPKDFDLSRQIVSVTKTWDYKTNCGFQPTKNQSSIRKIPLDWQTVMQFAQLIKSLPEDVPIFVKGKIYNSTVNERLARHCKKVDIPVISIHGLRHTHASLLLFAGVSIASVARRLGHSNMTTTQKTYLHIIQELESKDIDIIMRSLSNLNS